MKELTDRINQSLNDLVSDYKFRMEAVALGQVKDFFKVIPTRFIKGG